MGKAPILTVDNLVKRFPEVLAVDHISFALEPGICFGLLGPNGAGKTTAIEIIEHLQQPTSGAILYKGAPRGAAFFQEIGVQLQKTELPQHLTVREVLTMYRNLYDRQADWNELVSACRLEEMLSRDNRKISGGQRQRLFLAMALANDPELIFLDEPTTGLDPQSRHYLWDIIEQIKAAGKTIILTTHYMEEAQLLCDRIAIMDQGRIIALDSPGELLRQHAGDATLTLPTAVPEERLAGLPGSWSRMGETVVLHTGSPHDTLKMLLERGVDLSSISVRTQNLEDVFLRLTGKELRG